jgi:hypothetical protein
MRSDGKQKSRVLNNLKKDRYYLLEVQYDL